MPSSSLRKTPYTLVPSARTSPTELISLLTAGRDCAASWCGTAAAGLGWQLEPKLPGTSCIHPACSQGTPQRSAWATPPEKQDVSLQIQTPTHRCPYTGKVSELCNGNLGIHIIKDSEIQAAEFEAECYLDVFAAFQHKEVFLLHGRGQVSDLDVAILCFVTTMYTKIYWGQQGCEPDCPAPEIQTLVEVKENTYAVLSVQGWDSSDFIPPPLEQQCVALPPLCQGTALHCSLPGY